MIVCPLGADSTARHAERATDVDAALVARVAGATALMIVGTIEPRKNHARLLDAFDRLTDAHPDLMLVIVGRLGWHSDEVGDRIRRHPLFGDRVLWPSEVSDATLDRLYAAAHLVVVPSITEGFGLPVAEALTRGAIVISSDGGALTEIAGDTVDYFDPNDTAQLATLIERHLTDPDHREHARRRGADFRPRPWSEVGGDIARTLADCADGRIGQRFSGVGQRFSGDGPTR